MPAQDQRPVYQSGDCEVDLRRRELRAGGTPVPIGGRAFELIEVLVRSAGQLVTKDELMGRVWPGAIVNDNTLQVHIAALRKALGSQRAVLRTESGRGYRLLGQWTALEESARPAPQLHPAEPPIRADRGATNFPAIVTMLIGRGAAAERLHDLLSAYRVVTLTGPGGIGKTTLALQVARAQLDAFEDGGWLVELAELNHPAQVPAAVAAVLGLKFSGATISVEAVARAIGGARLLLLLDNCEHLVESVAELAEAIVHLCPSAQLLVTSREILRVDGEHVFRVPPLDVPSAATTRAEPPANHSAVALFIARIQALDAEFVADSAALSAIGEICRRLDGIPLAIEFAAARAATLGVEHVALGLEDRFGTLTSGRRTALPRHRTLRATLDWSYDLLPPDEATVLRRLSVFAGWFDFDAAVTVAACDDLGRPQAVEALANLVAKSLVSVDYGARRTRYRLLDTTRVYAAAKLAEQGDDANAASHHAKFFHDALARIAADAAGEAEDEFTIDADQLANVRVALEWSFSRRGDPQTAIGLATAASRYFLDLSLLTECLHWTERALAIFDEQSIGTSREMELRASLGLSLMFTRGNSDVVRGELLRALELAETLGARQRQLQILRSLHIYMTRIGDFRGALEVSRRSQVIAGTMGDRSSMAMADWMLGVAEHLSGDQTAAVEHCQSAMTQVLDHRRGNPSRIGFDHRTVTLVALARGLWLTGFPERAIDAAHYAVKEAEALVHPLSLCIAMIWTFYVFLWVGDWSSAEEIVERLVALTERYSLGPYQSVALGLKGQLLVDRGDLTEGAPLLRQHLETLREARHQILTTVFATALAPPLAQLGQVETATALLEEAIVQIGDTDTFDRPEIFRARAVLYATAAQPDMAEAERLLQYAIEEAQRQSALGWELRAATDLARLWEKADRITEAHDLLAMLYSRFTEGFETIDLSAARALLVRLSA